jgi:thymidylate synthase ThyX
MIEAKIVCDSLAPSGVRLTTFVLTYPRFIHSEFMTHRMFSRNASSSRAIPVKKQIQMIIDNPAIPLAFTKNQKGMQGGEILDSNAHQIAVAAWLEGRDRAVEIAQKLVDIEVHKQYANRVLEPYAHITVVCTATDYDNFFALRCHPDAQPEIHALADQMYGQYYLNKPKQLEEGEWHLPFVNEPAPKSTFFSEMGEPKRDESGTSWNLQMGWKLDDDNLIKQSVARCARVSYLNHDGTQTTLEQDLGLYDRLLSGNPIHASPAEHQAMALDDPEFRSGNFRSFIQYRKTLKNENISNFKGLK